MDDIVNPQDAELEEIVLGACLTESKAITLVAGILRPEVFYIEKNREIYAALQSMYRAGQVIDLMTVKEELTQRGKLDFIWSITPVSCNRSISAVKRSWDSINCWHRLPTRQRT